MVPEKNELFKTYQNRKILDVLVWTKIHCLWIMISFCLLTSTDNGPFTIEKFPCIKIFNQLHEQWTMIFELLSKFGIYKIVGRWDTLHWNNGSFRPNNGKFWNEIHFIFVFSKIFMVLKIFKKEFFGFSEPKITLTYDRVLNSSIVLAKRGGQSRQTFWNRRRTSRFDFETCRARDQCNYCATWIPTIGSEKCWSRCD